MARRLYRSIDEPIREGLTWKDLWRAQDTGLIWCWERGRQYRTEAPERSCRAVNGELVPDGWRGGVEKKLKDPLKKNGTLQYLATWQGMRGEDLDIDLDGERIIVCSRFDQSVRFSGSQSGDEEEGEAAIDE